MRDKPTLQRLEQRINDIEQSLKCAKGYHRWIQNYNEVLIPNAVEVYCSHCITPYVKPKERGSHD